MIDQGAVVIDNANCQTSRDELLSATAGVVDAILSAMAASDETVVRHSSALSIVGIALAGLVASLRVDGALSASGEAEMWRFVSKAVGSFPDAVTAMADRQLSLLQQAAGALPFDGEIRNG